MREAFDICVKVTTDQRDTDGEYHNVDLYEDDGGGLTIAVPHDPGNPPLVWFAAGPWLKVEFLPLGHPHPHPGTLQREDADDDYRRRRHGREHPVDPALGA